MLELFPGDHLWNRYRVESVAANGAWLTRLREPAEDAKSPHNFLLLAQDRQAGPAPLAELLSLAGTAIQLQISSRPEKAATACVPVPPPLGRRHAVPGAAGHASAFREVPLLGQVAWVGDPARGGMALVEAPPSTLLPELLAACGPLGPAAVLPLLVGLAGNTAAFLQAVEVAPAESPASQGVLRCLSRLLNPGAVVLLTDQARLGLRVALPEPMAELSPPRWAEFVAPELYRGAGASQAACVFSVARLGAFLMGAADASSPVRESAWAALAEWASGKRAAARELLEHPNAAKVPPELRSLLASCLAQNPASRWGSLRELHDALNLLARCRWSVAAGRCQSCGFILEAERLASACPGCGRKAVPAEAEKPAPALAGGTGAAGIAGSRSSGSATDTAAAAQLEKMTLIATGVFLSGEQKTPRMLRAFAIDTTPVTEGDYKRFLSTQRRPPRPEGPGSRGPEFDNHPVTRITWYEANEYAEFCGKRLPTIHEWEKAARGTDGRKFPFGNNYRANAVSRGAGGGKSREAPGPMPVGRCPAGASPYGVLDMAGNVLAWTSTARRAGQRLFRAVKGSCYLDGSPELARCAGVQYLPPERAEPYVGFRCVKDVE